MQLNQETIEDSLNRTELNAGTRANAEKNRAFRTVATAIVFFLLDCFDQSVLQSVASCAFAKGNHGQNITLTPTYFVIVRF